MSEMIFSILTFVDANGEIHKIDGSDEEAFDEAMSHEDWSLVFD